MRFYGELIRARFEQIAGAVGSSVAGLFWFRTDTSRPLFDDGATVEQVMLEKHLPEARRNTKVQLDDTGTGNEIAGVVPVTKGGTNKSSLAGEARNLLRVNAGETDYEFVNGGQVTTGSSGSASVITAAGGVSVAGFAKEIQYIEGNADNVNISASPQIGAGISDGDELVLRGVDNALKILFEDGNGLSLNGPWVAKKDSSLTLHWDTDQVLWVETSRRD